MAKISIGPDMTPQPGEAPRGLWLPNLVTVKNLTGAARHDPTDYFAVAEALKTLDIPVKYRHRNFTRKVSPFTAVHLN